MASALFIIYPQNVQCRVHLQLIQSNNIRENLLRRYCRRPIGKRCFLGFIIFTCPIILSALTIGTSPPEILLSNPSVIGKTRYFYHRFQQEIGRVSSHRSPPPSTSIYSTASRMSAALTVFLPACFARLTAFLAILAPSASNNFTISSAASSLTLSAPAFLINLFTGAFGISAIFITMVG
jgi:hypothetical protein